MQQAEALHFKICSVSDAAILYDLAVQTYNQHYTHLWDDQGAFYLQTFYSKSLFEANLQDPACYYYFIYHATELAGFFKIRAKALEPYPAEECLELNKIYILKKFTGMGIGHNTLSFISALAIKMNRRLLWLNVMDKSRAKNFYEQNGFSLVRETKLDYPHMKADLSCLSTYKKQLTKL